MTLKSPAESSVATGTLWRLGAAALADLIRSRHVSSREVVAEHLDRIASVNPYVNAITRVLETEALAEADRADRELARRRRVGPLHGVPISVKENVDVLGSPTTHGVQSQAEAYPARDALHIGLLKRAGAIVLSRTNLPEFALRWHTDNALHGATLNPWQPSLTAGGSSGGEAVALATGMSPLGLGNDDGGSLRYPAQCVGICSLKPSIGRVPVANVDRSGPPVSHQLLNVQGVMARSVEDLRLTLHVIGRFDSRDPWSIPPRVTRRRTGRPRVAVVPATNVSRQVDDGVQRAGQCLQEAGYIVVEDEPPRVDEAAEIAGRISIWDLRLNWERIRPLVSDDGRRHMELMLGLTGPITAEQYQQAYVDRLQIAQVWAEFQRRYPIILGPVSTRPPFPIGADLEAAGLASIVRSMSLLVAVNVLGLPAVVVPVGTSGGLPQVAQIIGPRNREDLCLDAAEAIESATRQTTPLDPRRSPVAADEGSTNDTEELLLRTPRGPVRTGI